MAHIRQSAHISQSHMRQSAYIRQSHIRQSAHIRQSRPDHPTRLSGRSTCRANIKNNYFAEMCSGSEGGSYLRLVDFCITHRQARILGSWTFASLNSRLVFKARRLLYHSTLGSRVIKKRRRRPPTSRLRRGIISGTMYLSISLRKSTPPRNRQPIVYYY